jgi:hypothetical protein
MALKNRRWLIEGLPILGFSEGSKGSMRAHCSSDKLCRDIASKNSYECLHYPSSYFENTACAPAKPAGD